MHFHTNVKTPLPHSVNEMLGIGGGERWTCWERGIRVSMEAARHIITASQVTGFPKYLSALPAGPNDRYGMFVPRLLLQLTQLSPGLMGKCWHLRGRVNISDNQDLTVA